MTWYIEQVAFRCVYGNDSEDGDDDEDDDDEEEEEEDDEVVLIWFVLSAWLFSSHAYQNRFLHSSHQ